MAHFLLAQDDKAQTTDKEKKWRGEGEKQPSEIRGVNIREAYVAAGLRSKDTRSTMQVRIPSKNLLI